MRLKRRYVVKRSSLGAQLDAVLLFVQGRIWLLCHSYIVLLSEYWRVCVVQPGIGEAMHRGWWLIEGVFL